MSLVVTPPRRLTRIAVAVSVSMLLSATASLMTACGLPLKKKELEALKTLSVAPTQVHADAYQPPKADKIQGAYEGSVLAATGGGILPYLFLVAIRDPSVDPEHSSELLKQHAGHEQTLKRHLEDIITRRMDAQITELLREDSFFGPRLSNTSQNLVRAEILSYGLVMNSHKEGEGVLLGARIAAKISVRNGSAANVLDFHFTEDSRQVSTLSDLLADPARLEAMLGEAVGNIGFDLVLALDESMGRE